MIQTITSFFKSTSQDNLSINISWKLLSMRLTKPMSVPSDVPDAPPPIILDIYTKFLGVNDVRLTLAS